MGISCDCDSGNCDWYYQAGRDFSLLDTKRARKCCSCGTKIAPGDTVVEFRRWRSPTDRCNYIEESIYGDEVPLAPRFMCETCGGLYFAIEELGMCCNIDDNIAVQIKEFRT